MPDCLEIFGQLCETLESMADRNVYHRDLKPSNIIIQSGHGGAAIIDFGLAKQIKGGEDVSVTRGGTPGWAPPERDKGVSGGFTDVYSMGQLLWCMLTGHDNSQMLMDHDINPEFIESCIREALGE